MMTDLFRDLPEAIENTLIIAKRCSFSVETHKPILPTFPGLKNNNEKDYFFKFHQKL